MSKCVFLCAYSAAVRQGIVDKVETALSDPQVKSVVICGQNGNFCGGMDMFFLDFFLSYNFTTLIHAYCSCHMSV